MIRRGLGLALFGWAVASAAAEVIPPPPAAHFNDYASLVSPSTAQRLDQQLNQFERDTSEQILVAIYPKMDSDSSVEDYTVRIAQSWHAGIKGKDNGAVLFIFAESHQIYLQVGYGLEGPLPDALAKQIIDNEITPLFKRGDYDGGVTAGVNAILAATRGEYHGSGRTVAEGRQRRGLPPLAIFGIFIVIFALSMVRNARVYQNSGHRGFGAGMLTGMFLGGGFGGGGGGGGGFGGGGFSGGGGGFGGGGAGGSW